MSIHKQVIARLLNCNAFNVDINACDSYDEHDVPSLDEVGHAFRMAAFDEVIRGRQHMILDDMSAQVLQAAGLMRIGKFVPCDHPQAMSWNGSHKGYLTAKGLEVARRMVAYEVTLRQRHMTDKDFMTWNRAVKSYAA